MEKNNDVDTSSEIHSNKVRKILGEIPRSLTIWSIVVITVIAIGLVMALCMLPYPYSNGESILGHLLYKN